MINYYSASAQGFFTSEVNGENIPSDCVEITEEYKAYLLSSESSAKKIAPDESGYPVIVDVTLSDSDKASVEKAWRDSELGQADMELNKVQDADPKAVGTVAQWREYRRALRNYPESEGFSSGIRPVSPK